MPATHLPDRKEIWDQLTSDDKRPATWGYLMKLGLIQWSWLIVFSFVAFACWRYQTPSMTQWLLMTYPLLAIALAAKFHALGVVLHDACHLPTLFSKPKRLALEIVCGFPIATTVRAMRFHHLRHHTESCNAKDPYFKPKSNRLIWAIWLRARGLLIIPFWVLRSLIGSVLSVLAPTALVDSSMFRVYRKYFLQDLNTPDENTNQKSIEEVIACANDERAQVLYFVGLGALTLQWPIELSLLYWIPVSIAGLLNAHRVIAEHRHIERTDSTVGSMLNTTVTHRWPWPMNSIFYPLNIGYHEAHHLFPTLKIAGLPSAHQLIQSHS